jgi:class 3 adenylate cyclase
MGRPRGATALPSDTVLRTGAILICDSSGFTRSILERGVGETLGRIHAMRRLLIPVYRHAGGEVYKVAADNLFSFFRTAEAAVAAALEGHRVLSGATAKRESASPFPVGVGIGFGELLYLPSEDDYYGLEVNLASKLGEDLAEAGETLLTEAAAASLGPAAPGRPLRWRRSVLSNVRIRFRSWAA